MADPRDLAEIVTAIRGVVSSSGSLLVPANVDQDANAIALAAWNAMQALPRRAQEVRASRNG